MDKLTDKQAKLLSLLFMDEHRDIILSGKWGPLGPLAGYKGCISKGEILRSPSFRKLYDEYTEGYMASLKLQAVMTQDDILSNRSLTPHSATQLAAAKDVLDRSSGFTKKTETIVSGDADSPICILPPKQALTPED